MAKRLLRDSTHIPTRTAVAIGAAVCLFCLTANAADISIDGYTFEAPPAEFDFEPAREYRVIRDSKLVAVFCGKHRGRVVLGCTLDDGKRPVIFLTEGMSKELEDEVLRHELAHVNGWEHG